jgi:hypothetical protein
METNTNASRRWRNRSIVRERDEHQVRWLWGMLTGIVLALAPAGAYLLCQNDCLKLAYQVNRLELEHEDLLEQARRLDAKRAELESPARIDAWARRDPGLVLPASEQVFIVQQDIDRSEGLMARAPDRSESPAVRTAGVGIRRIE